MNCTSGRLKPAPLLVGLSLIGSTAAAAQPSVRLELAGERAPENLSVLEMEGERYVPAPALLVLGWAVRWLDDERSSVAVSDGKATFQFEVGSDRARKKGGDPQPLQKAPIQENGQLLLPSSALADVLGTLVEWDEGARVLRLGTPPAPEPAKVRGWCDILGIRDPDVFHQSGFRVRLAMPQGTQLPEEQEFLLAGKANADACVQVFERYQDYPPKPLFGLSDEGELRLYPLAAGIAPHWAKMTAWRIERWPFVTPPVGKVTYVAVATTAEEPPTDLLEALRSREGLEGFWAIDAVEVIVTKAVTGTAPPE